MGIDLIRASLAQPMDWSVFERLAYDVLVQDDMPNLTKLGGYADGGVDAAQFSIYKDAVTLTRFVQISARKDQVAKCKDTIKRIKGNGYEMKRLTMVYKQEVSIKAAEPQPKCMKSMASIR